MFCPPISFVGRLDASNYMQHNLLSLSRGIDLRSNFDNGISYRPHLHTKCHVYSSQVSRYLPIGTDISSDRIDPNPRPGRIYRYRTYFIY